MALTLVGWAALARQASDDYIEAATPAALIDSPADALIDAPANASAVGKVNQVQALPMPQPLPTLAPLVSLRVTVGQPARQPSNSQPVVERSARPAIQAAPA
ncbi:MAG: hypothetical protein ACUVR3_00005 [Candidatus Roseilinea sp.]|uniref:hypothetical protein n=1 Tax=Candidatus Roseilinea sp. TaxID=2838777 RepID=UPI0040498AF7